ncbi:YncE family protein [Pseudofrankia asymbiotica]|uniref:YncE family protein n=1 Tax=Pseudofrankia asymbiotica TaxID=1834516 RepID=A0A1V2I293_9ACTN|nr:hypothetical protein [Pseudofrankia asymbiotica]ONH23544.1 hypothetical protein BL253_32645 [Pseudofrankia asymbiotica]
MPDAFVDDHPGIGAQPWGTIPVGLAPEGVAATDSLSNPQVYVANAGETTVTVIDAKLGITTVDLGADVFPRSIAIDTDARPPGVRRQPHLRASRCRDPRSRHQHRGEYILQPPVAAVAPSEGLASPRLYLVGGGTDTLRVLDPDTAEITASVPVGSGPIALAIQN